MSAVEEAVEILTDEMKSSEEFIRYQKAKNYIHNQPELEREVNEFRRRNFEIQNNEDPSRIYEELEQLEQEYSGLLAKKGVRRYLSAESEFCRMVQEINWAIIEETGFEVGFDE